MKGIQILINSQLIQALVQNVSNGFLSQWFPIFINEQLLFIILEGTSQTHELLHQSKRTEMTPLLLVHEESMICVAR